MSTYSLALLSGHVIWPIDQKSKISILDEDGVVYGTMSLHVPMTSLELARFVPSWAYLETDNCHVTRLSGAMHCTTALPFDTTVSTERASISVEDRMARLEGKLIQSERRELRLRKERDERKQKEQDDAQVIEKPPSQDANAEPAPKSDPAPKADPTPVKPSGSDSGA